MADTKKLIIKHLNTILKNELTAINQYFLHSRMLRHQGFHTLAAKEYEESIDEMKHADEIMARVLFLGGLPNLQDLGKLLIGETPKEMLQSDLKLEEKAIADLKEAIPLMEDARDFVSADILHRILESEEQHYDWLRQQLELMASVGVEIYLQKQI